MESPSLASHDLVLIFAVAHAGLGHLRVTDALYHGLPTGVHSLVLGAQDDRITWLHKISSTNIVLRRIFEWVQQEGIQDIFTGLYRRWLENNTELLAIQLQTVLEQRVKRPKTLLVVATHFGLAHQFGAIKDVFGAKHNVRVKLMVVVTDDSPLHIWCVAGADIIAVPSERTKQELERYHESKKLRPARYIVLPYMVSPRLALPLSSPLVEKRKRQLDAGMELPLHVAIPVSGAAVQLEYFDMFIRHFTYKEPQVRFHIVSKINPATRDFLRRMMEKSEVDLITSPYDKEVIELYETLYQRESIALEITKPSEQSFKALYSPRQRGGSILLFSEPVGRQEYDNLNFLARHTLLPTSTQQEELWKLAISGAKPHEELLVAATGWRGLRLPFGSMASATFVSWCRKIGIFERMVRFRGFPKDPELFSGGVGLFWKYAEEYLASSQSTS